MVEIFRIYKKDGTKAVEGASPLTITGIAADTQVAKGDYKAVRIVDGIESVRVDIPAFKTLKKVFDPTGDEKPTASNTVDEIKAWLTEHDIDFTGKTVKADLLALVPTE